MKNLLDHHHHDTFRLRKHRRVLKTSDNSQSLCSVQMSDGTEKVSSSWEVHLSEEKLLKLLQLLKLLGLCISGRRSSSSSSSSPPSSAPVCEGA